jgi:hypothetical protein
LHQTVEKRVLNLFRLEGYSLPELLPAITALVLVFLLLLGESISK